ncbi:MAG: hypothetical protein VKP62_00290 [Candidatus Sericytochromatia bacterium]|nr:hypothetical protein [Candidatus Sericytochromatia bacterium]
MTHLSNVPGGGAQGTGKLGGKRATGPIQLDRLREILEETAPADRVELAGAASQAFPLPPVYHKLSARDRAALEALPAEVRKELLTDVPAKVELARLEVSRRLQVRTAALIPGEGLRFEPPDLFRISDAAIAFQVLSDLTPQDRARLEGLELRRVSESTFDEAHLHRKTDGAAELAIEGGRGLAGQVGFQLARLFERFALTTPVGLMLRAWFPHALAEYRERRIEMGDAQAARMREVLVHELGHQVQFGMGLDLAGMREWALLSGWKDAAGNEAFGVDAEGRVRALNAGVRPARKDNFVYDNFTERLTPEAIARAASEIQDPELRREFEQTLKVKQNMREAIKEVFGVEALGYAMVNPLEDFAESFRAFYTDPTLLARKAPDKFLFLNASSRKYSPDQAQALLRQVGRDAQKVATELSTSGISQETFDRIAKANGIRANTAVLGSQAEGALALARKAGKPLLPLQQAFMLIQEKVSARDATFVATFTRDPAQALGALWSRLSPAEQGQFETEARRLDVIQRMQGGTMSFASAAAQGYRAIEVDAIRRFGKMLLDDAGFRRALQRDPESALAPVARGLPAVLREAVKQPELRASLALFAERLDALIRYDQVPLLGGGDLHRMFEANLQRIDEATLAASIGTLRENPKRMAEVFCGLGVVEVDGIRVPPGG